MSNFGSKSALVCTKIPSQEGEKSTKHSEESIYLYQNGDNLSIYAKSAKPNSRIRKVLENKSNTEEDRVAIVESQLAQAKLIAEEADRKYEEVKLTQNLTWKIGQIIIHTLLESLSSIGESLENSHSRLQDQPRLLKTPPQTSPQSLYLAHWAIKYLEFLVHCAVIYFFILLLHTSANQYRIWDLINITILHISISQKYH